MILQFFSLFIKRCSLLSNEVLKYSCCLYKQMFFYKIKSIIIACIYPTFWGVYFSLSRFIKLGETYDLYAYILNVYSLLSNETLILLTITIPNLILWIIMLLVLLKQFKNFLWNRTLHWTHYYHIKLLKYNLYYIIIKFLYKTHYIFFDFFISYRGATFFNREKEAPYILKLTAKIYYNFWIVHIIFILSILLELIIYKGKLYLSIYNLFIYPFICGLLHCFNTFGFTNFVNDCCKSDYIFQKNHCNALRYKNAFYIRYLNPEFYYGFKLPQQNLKEFEIAKIKQKSIANSYKNHRKLIYYIHGRQQNNSTILHPKPFNFRLAGNFLHQYHIRYVHSSTILSMPLHIETHRVAMRVFLPNPNKMLAFLYHPENNISSLYKATKGKYFANPEQIYKSLLPNMHFNEKNTLIDTIEHNQLMHWYNWCKEHPSHQFGNYWPMFSFFKHPRDSMQNRPDVIGKTGNDVYFGIDFKHNTYTNQGRNQALLIDEFNYCNVLEEFKIKFAEKFLLNAHIIAILENLADNCNDPQNHLRYWTENAAKFPATWKPPLRIPSDFDKTYITDNFIKLLEEALIQIQQISDKLFESNVPNNNQPGLSDHAIDIFAESFIKDILSPEASVTDNNTTSKIISNNSAEDPLDIFEGSIIQQQLDSPSNDKNLHQDFSSYPDEVD